MSKPEVGLSTAKLTENALSVDLDRPLSNLERTEGAGVATRMADDNAR